MQNSGQHMSTYVQHALNSGQTDETYNNLWYTKQVLWAMPLSSSTGTSKCENGNNLKNIYT